MRRIRFSRRARADLEEIRRYGVEAWGATQSEAYVRRIGVVIADVASGRRLGRSAAELDDGLFKTSAGSHMIYFRFAAARIHVVRILHQRMDPTRHGF